MARMRSKEESDTVQAVARALLILESLAKIGVPIGLTELTHQVGLKLTTVHRLLTTLMQSGFAEQEPQTMRYRLGLKAFEVGNAALYAMDVRAIARPFLKELVETLNETTNLAILDKGEVVYIDQVESTNIVIARMFARVGSRGPAHCTGSGKVLLSGLTDEELLTLLSEIPLARFTDSTITDPDTLVAEIKRIRLIGMAIDRGERDEGVCCIAAPVKNFEGRTVAAISISGPAARMESGDTIERFTHVVRGVAERISARLGFLDHNMGNTANA